MLWCGGIRGQEIRNLLDSFGGREGEFFDGSALTHIQGRPEIFSALEGLVTVAWDNWTCYSGRHPLRLRHHTGG
jgi:hypothetical protein